MNSKITTALVFAILFIIPLIIFFWVSNSINVRGLMYMIFSVAYPVLIAAISYFYFGYVKAASISFVSAFAYVFAIITTLIICLADLSIKTVCFLFGVYALLLSAVYIVLINAVIFSTHDSAKILNEDYFE